jgi:hypothetical protein
MRVDSREPRTLPVSAAPRLFERELLEKHSMRAFQLIEKLRGLGGIGSFGAQARDAQL